MSRYRITISSPNKKDMIDLVWKHKIRLYDPDHGIRYSEETGYQVDGVAEQNEIQSLESAGIRVQRHEDVDEAGKVSQKEVGKGNRYIRPGSSH